MALRGYEQRRSDIVAKIENIRLRLGVTEALNKPIVRKEHRISPEGRARIAAAQLKRWASQKEGKR
jgi:hypothetical protein